METKPTYEELEQRVKKLEEETVERKRAEEALRASEEFLNSTGKMAKVGGWEIDGKTKKVFWTKEIYNITEVLPDYDPSSLEEEAIVFFSPEDQLRLKKAIQRAFERNEPYDMESQITTAKGNNKWVHILFKPVTVDGKAVKLTGTFQDITERKQAEEEILQSKILLESSIESPKDMIILSLDREYRYLYFNKTHAESMSHVFGTRPQIGDYIFDHMKGEDDIEKVKKHYDRALAGEGHVAIEEYGEDQLRYYYEIRYNPVYDGKNEIIGVTAFAQNITERKQIEEALKESEGRLNGFYQAAFEGIAMTEQGKIIDFNRQFADIFGYERDELIGREVMDLIAEEDRELVLKNIRSDFDQPYEHKALKKDGSIIFIEVHGQQIQFQGRPARVTAIHDLTDRKQSEEALRDSEKRSRAWLEHSPACTKIVDRDFNLQYMSSAGVEGLKIDDVTQLYGKPYPFYFYPESFRRLMTKNLEEAKETGKVIAQEASVVDIKGDKLWFHSTLVPMNDDEGQFDYIMVVSIDTTERNQSVEALNWGSSVNAALAKLSRALIDPAFSIQDIADTTLEYSRQLTDSENGFVSSIDPQTGDAIAYTITHMMGEKCLTTGEDKRIAFPIGPDGCYPGLWGYALNTGEGFYTNSPDTHEAAKGIPEGHIPLQNFLTAPAMVGDKPIGQIALSNSIAEFTNRELDAVKRLADLYAAAVQRKQAEEAIQESEEQYRNLVETSQDLIWKCDSKGRFTYLNPAWESILGYKIEEMFGRTFSEFKPPEIVERDLKTFRNIIEGTDTFGYETIYIAKSGELKSLVFNARILKDAHGNTIGTQGTAYDITERKRAEEALRESEERFRTVLETNPDPVVVYDTEGNVTYFNPAFTRVFGWTLQECLGKKIDFFVPEETWIETKMMIDKVMSGEGFSGIETRRYIKEGNTIPVSISGAPNQDQDGNVLGSVVNLRDITERKRFEDEKTKLESQLKQAQKMESIGTLAGGIAHDFNNILSPILIYSEMVLNDLPDNSPFRHKMENVIKAGERASDLVQQILTFSRQSEKELQAVKISFIIKEALKLLRASLPSTIKIRQRIEAKLDTVFADTTQIHQVVMNLCTNAAHAMRDRGGVLDVSLQNEYFDAERAAQYPELNSGTYLRLSIKDTGYGMDRSVLEHIFDPYFTTKEKGEGTGLGLAVVHGIVKSYNGTITVESEPEKGSTFHLFFPIIEGDLFEQTKSEVQVPRGTERILFVDDEKYMVDAIKWMLEELGYEVAPRTSSIEALEAFRNNPEHFDLVITDMTMPQMTGDKLAKEILSIRPNVPIILCTGFSELINEEKAKKMGIHAFVMKPIVRHKIAQTIRDVLEEKK